MTSSNTIEELIGKVRQGLDQASAGEDAKDALMEILVRAMKDLNRIANALDRGQTTAKQS